MKSIGLSELKTKTVAENLTLSAIKNKSTPIQVKKSNKIDNSWECIISRCRNKFKVLNADVDKKWWSRELKNSSNLSSI